MKDRKRAWLKTARAAAAAATLAAAVFLSGCGGNAGTELTPYQADDGEQTETGAGSVPGKARSDYVLQDGTRFYSSDTQYTETEAERLMSETVAAAEEFCYLTLSHDGYSAPVSAQVETLLTPEELGGRSFSPDNIDILYLASGMKSEFLGFTPAYIGATVDDTYGDVVNVCGTADVVLSNDRVPEDEYDMYVQLAFVKIDGKWKIYHMDLGRLYYPGTCSVTQNEEYDWAVDISDNIVARIDFKDPQGYLTDYQYDREYVLGGDGG